MEMHSDNWKMWAQNLQYMLSNKCSVLRHLNFTYLVIEEESDENFVAIQMESVHTQHVKTFYFNIPNEIGLYEMAKGRYYILPQIVGTPSEEHGFPTEVVPGSVPYFGMIHELWSKVARQLCFKGAWEPDILVRGLAAFFTNTELVRSIPDYASAAELKAITKMVLLPEVENEYNERIPHGFRGYVDPNTSPTTNQVGRIYLLARGARIEGNKLIPSQEVLSDMMIENSIFPTLCGTQLYKGRSPVRRHLSPLEGDHPRLRSVFYQGDLCGVELQTALMAHPYNQHDAIVISTTAANKLRSHQIRPFSFVCATMPQVLVSSQEYYNPSTPIALYEDEDGEVIEIKPKFYRPMDSVYVESIKTTKVVTNNQVAFKVRVLLRSVESCYNADKIITRHGGKGVVVIIPDEEMPRMPDGSAVEALVHPVSVAARQNMAMLAEMSYHRQMDAQGDTARMIDPQEIPDWEYLVENDYATKVQLQDPMGFDYPHPTMVGPVFWLRTDSVARNRQKAASDKAHNPNTKKFDSTESGTRFDLTTRTILWGTGLKKADHLMAQQAFDRAAVQQYGSNIEALTCTVEEDLPI